MKLTEKLKLILAILFISLCLWASITCTIQRFKCDTMTETQLFKRIPQSFVCNWIKCN
jgi:hypothetical protein